MKFPLGQTVMTRGVADFIEENKISTDKVLSLFVKHGLGDWGEVCNEDKESNDYSLENEGRLMSVYTLHGKKVYIITEWDRSVTTLLFPDEY